MFVRRLRQMRQALGVRGAFRSALLSTRHTDSLTSLITHSNVICDISSESDRNIEGRLLFGTIPYPATHPRLAKSKFSVKSNASITQFGESSRIGPGSVVHIEGDLLIGRSFIHSHARLICEDEITIGDGCAIA
jgi:hypothetical protein